MNKSYIFFRFYCFLGVAACGVVVNLLPSFGESLAVVAAPFAVVGVAATDPFAAPAGPPAGNPVDEAAPASVVASLTESIGAASDEASLVSAVVVSGESAQTSVAITAMKTNNGVEEKKIISAC